MKSCVFFGHRDYYNYSQYKNELKIVLRMLIKKYNVTRFYAGGRGAFDQFCSSTVHELKKEFPDIEMCLFLSYLPVKKENFLLPANYDSSVYALEKPTPPKFAILKTNEKMIDECNFVLSGVCYSWGGAYTAISYAKRKKRPIIPFSEFIIQKEKHVKNETALINLLKEMDCL